MKKILFIFVIFILLGITSPIVFSAELTDPYGYVYVVNDKKEEMRINLARVVLFSKNNNGTFDKWAGDKYYQDNPVFTNLQGEYSFLVPDGEYYLVATKDGYQYYRSAKFVAVSTSPNVINIKLTEMASNQKGALGQAFQSLGIATDYPDYVLMLYIVLVFVLIVGIILIMWLYTRYRNSR